MINILASTSEFERELIQARMTEGRKRARGQRREVWTQVQAQPLPAARGARAAGESQSTVARTYNVDAATISRLQRTV